MMTMTMTTTRTVLIIPWFSKASMRIVFVFLSSLVSSPLLLPLVSAFWMVPPSTIVTETSRQLGTRTTATSIQPTRWRNVASSCCCCTTNDRGITTNNHNEDEKETLTKPVIHWNPSYIQLRQVYQTYPTTLFRTLFSSVPRREYALNNITCTLENGVVLLLGASSSGKSTILKLVEGIERPSQGHVRIGCHGGGNILFGDDGDYYNDFLAKPILLDDRSPLPSSVTIQSYLMDCITTATLSSSSGFKEVLLQEVSRVFGVSLEQTLDKLSPSEYYKVRLAHACLKSSVQPFWDGSNDSHCNRQLHLPGPILLLDEWMDVETSQVVGNVVSSCWDTIVQEWGGIIICVTHKPHLFLNGKTEGTGSAKRKVTLSAGKILSMV